MSTKLYKKPLIIVVAIYGAVLIASIALLTVFFVNWGIHSYEPEEAFGSYVWNANSDFDVTADYFPSLVLDENAEELKVMQIADPQLKFGSWTQDVKTMALLDAAMDEEKPDIAVCTGDLTLSIFTYDAYRYFADHMEKRKQYWTISFGNHDSQFDCSKYTLAKLMDEYEYCLFDAGPENVKGTGNYPVNIFKGEKKAENLAYSLIIMDSNMYPDANTGLSDWVYDWFGTDQIEWYEWVVNGIQNVKSDVQSTVFFHIPVKEFADMYYADLSAKGQALPTGIDVSKLLPVSGISGAVCESDKKPSELIDEGYNAGIFYQGKNTGFYSKAVELGCTKAVFCGHDHINTLRGNYGDLFLSYGRCCGYHTYPYFERDNILLKLFGLSGTPLFNMEHWLDGDGNSLDKGVTNIFVSMKTADYGTLKVNDRGHSYYKELVK